MDPVTLMLLSGAVQTVGAGIGIAGKIGQMRGAGRAARLQQYQIWQNTDMVNRKSTFEQNKVSDQLDEVSAAQTNYYTGGGIDPTWGSPALMQAESAAAAEQDRLLIAARAQQEKADMAGQAAGIQSRASDTRRALGVGVATDFLNLASSWMSLGANIAKGGVKPGAGGPMRIGTVIRGGQGMGGQDFYG